MLAPFPPQVQRNQPAKSCAIGSMGDGAKLDIWVYFGWKSGFESVLPDISVYFCIWTPIISECAVDHAVAIA